MKKLFCMALSLFFACILTVSCGATRDISSFEAMNTFMTVQVYGRGAARANAAVKARVKTLESYLSTTDENSDIFMLNERNLRQKNEENADGATDVFFAVHEETAHLAEYALFMAEQTGGALNPALFAVTRAWGFTTGNYRVPSDEELSGLLQTIDYNKIRVRALEQGGFGIYCAPGIQLDFGAIGKGFAGDEALSVLRANGIQSALLDLGGNVQVLGAKPDGSDWTIGIKNPDGGSAVAALRVRDSAVITSGGYERFFTADDGKNYIHIFDGTTGRPVENDLTSVTVVTSRGVYGDALSTALFVMGSKKACDFWRSNKNGEQFDAVFITKDGRFLYTSGLTGMLRVLAPFADVVVVER